MNVMTLLVTGLAISGFLACKTSSDSGNSMVAGAYDSFGGLSIDGGLRRYNGVITRIDQYTTSGGYSGLTFQVGANPELHVTTSASRTTIDVDGIKALEATLVYKDATLDVRWENGVPVAKALTDLKFEGADEFGGIPLPLEGTIRYFGKVTGVDRHNTSAGTGFAYRVKGYPEFRVMSVRDTKFWVRDIRSLDGLVNREVVLDVQWQDGFATAEKFQ